MPTWIASGPGRDWQTAMPSRISSLSEPLLFADHLALHLSDERDGTAESEETEAQVVPDELADRHAMRSLFWISLCAV